jgi:hypothetical protein
MIGKAEASAQGVSIILVFHCAEKKRERDVSNK